MVNQMEPSDLQMMSFGELRGLPSNRYDIGSAMGEIRISPVRRWATDR
jgi:hypothetical protein